MNINLLLNRIERILKGMSKKEGLENVNNVVSKEKLRERKRKKKSKQVLRYKTNYQGLELWNKEEKKEKQEDKHLALLKFCTVHSEMNVLSDCVLPKSQSTFSES